MPCKVGHNKGQKWRDPDRNRGYEEEVARMYRRKKKKKQLLNGTDNHNGVITHLEPDILQCEAKWALGSIIMNKASGCYGIPVELFKIRKDDAVKGLHSICQQIGKLSSEHRTENIRFHSNPKGKQCQRMFKLLYSCAHFSCQKHNA